MSDYPSAEAHLYYSRGFGCVRFMCILQSGMREIVIVIGP